MLLYVYCSQMASRFVQRKDDRQEYSGNDILFHLKEHYLSYQTTGFFGVFFLKKRHICIHFHLISTYLLFFLFLLQTLICLGIPVSTL